MEKRVLQKSVSAMVVFVMIFSLFSVNILFTSKTYAAETADPDAANNRIIIPSNMKTGNSYRITAEGDRFADVYSRYVEYLSVNADNTQIDSSEVLTDKVDMFTEGESFYIPSKIVVTRSGYYPKTIVFGHNISTLSNDFKYDLTKYDGAGKYNVKAEFVKCMIDITAYDYSNQDVKFRIIDNSTVSQNKTFYIASKIKLYNNSKKGRLSKKYSVKYLYPTKKFGKLPKPKARAGFRFIGWYSKKSGGHKITKSTKVPTRNTQTIYARYKKI